MSQPRQSSKAISAGFCALARMFCDFRDWYSLNIGKVSSTAAGLAVGDTHSSEFVAEQAGLTL